MRSKSETEDNERGMEQGAKDYMVVCVPFDPQVAQRIGSTGASSQINIMN